MLLPAALMAQVPVANFTGSPITGCAPLLVQFTNTSTNTTGSATYSWNLGNSTTSVLQNPSTTYTTPGTYTVTLTVTNPGTGGGTNTKTINSYITVNPAPSISWTTSDSDGCPPHPVSFTNTTALNNPAGVTTATYLWNFGNGQQATTANASHTYTVPGTYNVTLQVTNSFGCSRTLVKSPHVIVFTPPVADFSASPTAICAVGSSTTFTPTVTGSAPYTYSWNFGDGSPASTASNPNHTYNASGAFTVTMIVTDSHGCKDTVTKPNYIGVGSTTASFTSAPANICVGSQASFTNTTTPNVTGASWDFGDGGTATGVNTTHVYATAGTYTVTMIAQNGVCLDTATQTVTVQPAPVISFTGSPLNPCPAPATIQFSNATTGATSYNWYFGDGNNSTATNPSNTYTGNGYYNVALVATSQYGCKDTLTLTNYIKIHDVDPTTYASPASGCVPLTVSFSTIRATTIPNPSLYPYPAATYSWNFGDGSPVSTAATPSHVYTATGNYTAIVTVTTANGCTVVDSVIVSVGSLPVAGFTGPPDTVCVHENVHFTNTTTGATTYWWDFGDNGTSNTFHADHEYTIPGTYYVSLVAYNNGCFDSVVSIFPIVVRPSNAVFQVIYDCDTPTLVKFTNTSVGATSQLWLFSDNTSSTATAPTHQFPALGNHTVTLITTNSTYGCSDTMVNSIELFAPPVNFTADDTAVCWGDTVQFSAIYPVQYANRYDWKLGPAGTPPGLPYFYADSPAVVRRDYPNPGLYTVVLYVRNTHMCWDSLRKNNYVLVAKPQVDFSANPTVACIPLPVSFTNLTTNTPGAVVSSVAWSFGTGATSTATAPSHTYTTAGLYDVKLVVTDNVGCTDSLTKPAYIDARKPHAAFVANDTSACIGQSVQFVNNSTASGPTLTYLWDFGDNTPASTVLNPVHVYNATGSYTVRLIVTDASGCKDTLTKTGGITVTKPNAAFAVSDTLAICPPLLVNFTNQSTGALTWNWNFGNGTSIVANPSNPYTNPGVYNISLVVSDLQGCTDTANATVRVLGYAGALTYTPLTGCNPLTVNFTATLTNVPSLVWDFSDGSTAPATGSTISHVYTAPGAYVPKLLISDGQGCTNSSQGLDTIKVDDVTASFTTGPLCEKSPATFTSTSTGVFSAPVSWAWQFPNGAGAGNTTSFNFATPGTYPVRLIVTNAKGCKDTLTQNVTVRSIPNVTAGRDTIVCVGDAAQLNGYGGVSYAWTPTTNVNNPAIGNPKASPTVNTTYIVTGTDAFGCKDTAMQRVNLKTKTTSFVMPDTGVCFGNLIQLRAWDAEVYSWTPANTLTNANTATPIASPPATITYTVVAKEGSCIPDTNRVKVTVYPKPVVNAGADISIVNGKTVTLTASGNNVDRYEWTPADWLSCTACGSTVASPPRTTTYTLIGTSKYSCSDTDDVTVRVICDQSQVFIPNTFTPNGDGENDFFYPHGIGLDRVISFRVYSRWGEMVFERGQFAVNERSMGWDGTHKGRELPPDVFMYVMEAVCENGETLVWKGDVTLIR